MGKKRSIYTNDLLENFIGARSDEYFESRSVSNIISVGIGRHGESIRRAMPTFTLPEWMLIFEALPNVCEDPAMIGAVLSINVRDAVTLDELDQKWGVNGSALCARLESLSYDEQVAVVDAAERFQFYSKELWPLPNAEPKDGEAMIKKIVGARCIAPTPSSGNTRAGENHV